MAMITRMLTGLLTRSAWLLGPDRAEWIEGLVAELSEIRAGRARAPWLLGGVWLTLRELLRRSAIRVSVFIAAAGIVLCRTPWRPDIHSRPPHSDLAPDLVRCRSPSRSLRGWRSCARPVLLDLSAS